MEEEREKWWINNFLERGAACLFMVCTWLVSCSSMFSRLVVKATIEVHTFLNSRALRVID